MIKPFKLLNGYTYSDEYRLVQADPPFNLSRRHWNMLPQDLRGATLQEMECYIQGWEDARSYVEANPYQDRIRRSLWNRGFLRWRGRTRINYGNVNPNPPIDETYPEFYNRDRVNRDEEVYLEGWATAQLGLPLNENPHTYGSNQFNMWYIGWNDFVDNH
jgi:hypothetical protein